MFRILGELLHPIAQLRHMHAQVLRSLHIGHASLLDQAHSLKLELAGKLPSLHDPPPAPSKHLTRCLRNRVQATIEPSPIAFAKLLYNVRKNRLDSNIVTHEVALSSTSGRLQMRYQWEHAVAAPLPEPGGRISVEKIAGDALCAKLAFKPDVIKIDVEGHELKV